MKLILVLISIIFACSCQMINKSDATMPYKTPLVEHPGEVLDFYSTKSPYGEFSNFAQFPIQIDGVQWPTSEHYYQAHKYSDSKLISWVQNAHSPMEAAQRGRDKFVPKRKTDIARLIASILVINLR